jgi:hypothetical protein
MFSSDYTNVGLTAPGSDMDIQALFSTAKTLLDSYALANPAVDVSAAKKLEDAAKNNLTNGTVGQYWDAVEKMVDGNVAYPQASDIYVSQDGDAKTIAQLPGSVFWWLLVGGLLLWRWR